MVPQKIFHNPHDKSLVSGLLPNFVCSNIAHLTDLVMDTGMEMNVLNSKLSHNRNHDGNVGGHGEDVGDLIGLRIWFEINDDSHRRFTIHIHRSVPHLKLSTHNKSQHLNFVVNLIAQREN